MYVQLGLATLSWSEAIYQREDPRFLEEFLARDADALDRCYRDYGRVLYSTAYNVLGQRNEAEDCVHDVLVRVWTKPKSYKLGLGSLRNFLVVSVRNEAISRRRARARHHELEQMAAKAQVEPDFTEVDHVESQRLKSAIAALPENQRRALLMSYYGYKTHRQIAAALGEPVGTIKSRIALAMQKLHAALATESEKANQ